MGSEAHVDKEGDKKPLPRSLPKAPSVRTPYPLGGRRNRQGEGREEEEAWSQEQALREKGGWCCLNGAVQVWVQGKVEHMFQQQGVSLGAVSRIMVSPLMCHERSSRNKLKHTMLREVNSVHHRCGEADKRGILVAMDVTSFWNSAPVPRSYGIGGGHDSSHTLIHILTRELRMKGALNARGVPGMASKKGSWNDRLLTAICADGSCLPPVNHNIG